MKGFKMNKFVCLLDSKEDLIWSKDWIVENVTGIEDVRFVDGIVFCKESRTGTYYKCSQEYNGEDEPEWDRAKYWETNSIIDAKKDSWKQDNNLDRSERLAEEIELNNRYYVEDDVHAGYESNDNWRDGFNG